MAWWTKTALWGWWWGLTKVIASVRDSAGWGNDADVHGDCDASGIWGCDAECAVAERGDADAGVCVGDAGVHGVVANTVKETTVTATASDANASVEVKLNGVVDQDGVVGLVVGSGNVIAVVVTAQDGVTSQTYTVTVTRAGSADASLSALSLSGVTLMPAFASGTTA